MVKNVNECLPRGKVDISDTTCLKDDKGQWLIMVINPFNHAAFEDFGIREEQRRLKNPRRPMASVLPNTQLPGETSAE
jgi:hypothetical protein